MNKWINRGLMLSALSSLTLNAADTSNINITGNIVASPCVIDADNSVISVDLKDIQAASLATAGSASEWKNFDIAVKNCPASTTMITIKFTGTPDSTDATRYKNTGTANNIAVEVAGLGGMNMGNNVVTSLSVNKTTNSGTFTLRARAYSANGGVMPGSINAAIVVTFTYK